MVVAVSGMIKLIILLLSYMCNVFSLTVVSPLRNGSDSTVVKHENIHT